MKLLRQYWANSGCRSLVVGSLCWSVALAWFFEPEHKLIGFALPWMVLGFGVVVAAIWGLSEEAARRFRSK